jgi:hypothetical protein
MMRVVRGKGEWLLKRSVAEGVEVNWLGRK